MAIPVTQRTTSNFNKPDWREDLQGNPSSLQASLRGGQPQAVQPTSQSQAPVSQQKTTGLGGLKRKIPTKTPTTAQPQTPTSKPMSEQNYEGANKQFMSAIQSTQIDPNQYAGSLKTQQAKAGAYNAGQQYNAQTQQAVTQNQFEKADIDLANDQFRSNFKNSQYVDKLTTGVQDQYRMGVRDPSQIAKNLGMSMDDVNLVVQGRGSEILQFSDQKMDELSKSYQRKTQDIDREKQRALSDFETAKTRMDQKYKWNMDDITKDFGLANQLARKMGAGSGAILSSGYQEGMTVMRQAFDTTLSRLNVDHQNDTYDLIQNKTRMLEDIDTNISRLKYTHDQNIKANKEEALGVIASLRSKYQISDTNFLQSIQQAETNYLANVNKIFEYDMGYMKEMMGMYNNEIDNMNKMNQQYMSAYASNPSLANAMYPEMGSQVQGQMNIQQSIKQYGNNIGQVQGLEKGVGFLSKTLSSGTNGNRNSCGQFSNDYLGSIGALDGGKVADSLESKKATVNSQTPVVGSVLVMDSPTRKANGHTAIVTSINPDGSMELADANGFGAGTNKIGSFKGTIKNGQLIVTNYKGTFNAGNTYGFHVPSTMQQQAQQGGQTQGNYTQQQKNMMDQMDIKNISKEEKATLKTLGLTEVDVSNYKANNKPKFTESQQNMIYKTAVSSVDKLRTAYMSQQQGYETAIDALDQGGKGTYTSAITFLKGLDGSVVKEGEYKAFTNAGIPITDRLKTWIDSGFTGDVPEDVKDKFRSLIVNLKASSDRIYKNNIYKYADNLEANLPGQGITLVDAELQSGYVPMKSSLKSKTQPANVNDMLKIAKDSMSAPKKSSLASPKIQPLPGGKPR